MDDAGMLAELLEDERLAEKERKAFTDMSYQVETGRALTEKQRKWVASRWEKLGHGVAPAENLFSSGKVAPADPNSPNAVTFPWEKPGYKMPKPPGRK